MQTNGLSSYAESHLAPLPVKIYRSGSWSFLSVYVVENNWAVGVSPPEQVPPSSAGGRQSIFARQIAAQRVKEGKTQTPVAAQTPETSMDIDQRDAAGASKKD